MRLLKNTNFKFIEKSRVAFILSGLLILGGLISEAVHGGPELSIDFTGGTILQVQVTPAPSTPAVREALEAGGFQDFQVQDFGSDSEFLITFREVEGGDEGLDTAERMLAALSSGLPGTQVEMRREESVGPKIGDELKTAAVNSVVAALLLIVLYITVRFIFRYGIAAIVALVHDVIITLGIFSILNKEISLTIIAAFLTIIGYSLNDTIVVFDRIRENMRLRRKESYEGVVNRSINETLSRTIVTSLTTLFVALTLFIWGGPVIHDFAFALVMGVVIGTYSSIFVASPVLVWWHKRQVTDAKRAQPSL
ncbi:MAG TPA: protein translocase subunit SecF [Candidatus Krumholzibacteria bacterium]|nr:protein translocase subunit SecF [Candidatus Krumholzibacteria bacterium]HRX50855.1 protein translocase subunit SecF [Candidatus Krumholzibacteria bacterium]